jgi:VanZ family protein
MPERASAFRKSFWVQVAPALAYAALIFVGGTIAMPELPVGPPMPSDKLMHFAVFGGLQILMFRAVRWGRSQAGPATQNVLAALLSSAAGALLEFWQASLPHRSAELGDWLADHVGVLRGPRCSPRSRARRERCRLLLRSRATARPLDLRFWAECGN